MAGFTIVASNSVVKVSKTTDIKMLAPLGCGTQTGAMSVFEVMKPTPSTSFGVFGLGGVGMAALLAAKSLGVTQIIAVDIIQSRLDLAKDFGATHVINGKDLDIVEQISKITDGKLLDQVVEATGVDQVIKTAFNCVAGRGKYAQVGVVGSGKGLMIDTGSLQVKQKTIYGILEGDSNPSKSIPKLVGLVENGEFPLQRMSKFFPIAQFQEAIDSMLDGTVSSIFLSFYEFRSNLD